MFTTLASGLVCFLASPFRPPFRARPNSRSNEVQEQNRRPNQDFFEAVQNVPLTFKIMWADAILLITIQI